MTAPDIALIISTYQKPGHLQRVLASVEAQRGSQGRFEVVVTDDGSTDETEDLVGRFARRVSFPVRYITHPHQAFQLARSRNDGFSVSSAPYVLFLDGDCILPPDHLAVQLRHGRPGVVMAGYCCRLDEATSRRITLDTIPRGDYLRWIPRSELRKLQRLAWKSTFYNLIRHPTKPRLFGGNIAIWREDFERINGFDENFIGWGGEDDDLRFRLRAAGIQIRSILHWTRTYHLWHPPDPSAPAAIGQGANIDYLCRRGRFTRCINGLQKRSLADMRVRVLGPAEGLSRDPRLVPLRSLQGQAPSRPEIEIACVPGATRFSGRAEFNVLVVLELGPQIIPLARQAQLVISDLELPGVDRGRLRRLSSICQALQDAA